MEPVFRECRVKWRDTCHIQGWQSALDLQQIIDEPAMEMESVGWLIHQDERFVLLAMSVCDKRTSDMLKIPHSAIVELLVMRPDDVKAD